MFSSLKYLVSVLLPPVLQLFFTKLEHLLSYGATEAVKKEEVQGLIKHLKYEMTEQREKEEVILHEHTEERVCDWHLSWVTIVTTSELLGKLLCNCDHKSKETGQGGEGKK